ncbi:MAG: hypothetical protein QOF36_2014, partial [Microbacteriaceae bacterium]|nr:hypothetical protein [Microbacteriaceae bacterium]
QDDDEARSEEAGNAEGRAEEVSCCTTKISVDS